MYRIFSTGPYRSSQSLMHHLHTHIHTYMNYNMNMHKCMYYIYLGIFHDLQWKAPPYRLTSNSILDSLCRVKVSCCPCAIFGAIALWWVRRGRGGGLYVLHLQVNRSPTAPPPPSLPPPSWTRGSSRFFYCFSC